MCSIQAQTSTTKRYHQLQKNPAYQSMPLIEIAAEIDDFPALSFFMRQASLNGLRNAYVTLEEKMHQLEASLEEKPARDIIGVARVAETKSKIQHRIDLLKDMMSSLDKQIQRVSGRSA